MAGIQWNETLVLDIPEIDRQHRKLIEMMNDLNLAMRGGHGNDVLGRILAEMISYARTHFVTEESYFDRFGYPDAAAHKAVHAAFTKKVVEFKDGFDRGRVGLSVEVLTFLTSWLQKHIKSEDRQYVGFFQEHGVK